MTSIIKLHALSGVMDESPPCYILQVDEFKFLLDCGWDENFDMEFVNEVKKHVPQIDAVLLSYPDLYHLGALPYLVGKCGLNCPVYATIPVYKMGQMFMYDIYQSRHNTEEFDLFTLDDVDTAFDKVVQLKYSQTITLHGKGQGIQITPLPGGHMIGGTIWRILKDGDEELIYAVDYNHKKERHLNGCALDAIERPTLLITDAYNSMYAQARRRTRDEELVTNILQTMRGGGNCLIAVDTAGRVLELAHLLDQLWRNADSGLMTYSLAFLNNVSYNVVEFGKSQMEWMSEKIMRSFEDRRNNPFSFRHVQLCHNLGELAQVSEPKVVLASTPDMESGFSRDLFIQWCKNNKNTIILTSRTGPNTLARKLIDNPEDRRIAVDVRRRVKLDAHEMEEYMRQKHEKEILEAALKAREKAEAESSDESDMETDGEPQKHDLMPQVMAKPKGGFFKLAKKSYPMYPHHEERLKWDEYGEMIKHSDFVAVADLVGGTTRRDRGHRGRGRGPGERRGGNNYREPEEEEPEPEPELEPEPEPEPEPTQESQTNQDVPTKCVSSHQIVDVNARIVFIDFEGRSDGESMKKLLSQVKPKQMIIVHGSKDATEFLADYCRVTPGLVSGTVWTPAKNDTIDATTEGAIYQVKLKDSLMTALRFFKAKDLEVAWVDARIQMTLTKTDTSARAERGRSDAIDEEKKDKEMIPTLCAINAMDAPDHTSVFVNEPKLSDLKTVLVKAGLQAEFIAGVLVVNNVVAVKRNEAGKLQIEGCMSEDYYRVRSIIYDQYAIV